MIKSLVSAILICTSTLAFCQSTEQIAHPTKILRVTDGDTVVIEAPYLPEPLKPQLSVRIYGVDTPEKGSTAKCEQEKQKGKEASAYVQSLIKNSSKHEVVFYKWDKYGGRVIGDIILDGNSLRWTMITSGLAREYYGGRKRSWCN